jgi:hypothetical protein
VADQGPPPPRSGRLPTAGRQGDSRGTGRRYWDEPEGGDEEHPPWAGPGVTPRRAGQEARPRRAHARPEAQGGHAVREEAARAPAAWQDDARDQPGGAPGRGSRSRKAAARSRRRSRITWVWGVAALVVVVIVAGVLFLMGRSHPAPAPSDGFVSTFQHGEFKAVPNTCTAVTSQTLNQALPGKRRMVAPHSLDGGAQSLCNWTLDAPPLYRVLEVTVQAYSPSGLATGNGSATNAAVDAYLQAEQTMRHPAKATHLPPATVVPLHGLGAAAFAALQVVQARGVSTDLETVVARDSNVVITVVVQGPHARTGRYRAAPRSELQSTAITAATDITHRLH